MTLPGVTQCPNCNTVFRVTQLQLRTANGSVRCGSCLTVFDARSHMEGEQDKTGDRKPIFAGHANTVKPQGDTTGRDLGLAEEASATVGILPLEITTQADPKGDLDNLLDTLEKDQIAVEDTRRRSLAHQAGWLSLVVLLLFSLGLQFLWFNKDILSMKPTLRGIYQQTCELLSCKLPTVTDPSKIRSQQLLVRSHPELDDVLIIDTIIINQATNAQPWPLLSFSFSDINNRPVASRHFKPKEFLGGRLAGSKEIPPGQPIRLSLEVIDPGQDAVNYSLSFYPNPAI